MRTREIINLADGARLGPVGDADMLFDPDTGQIIALLVPASERDGLFRRRFLTVPWASVKKIGPDVVIVDIDKMQPL